MVAAVVDRALFHDAMGVKTGKTFLGSNVAIFYNLILKCAHF